MGLLSRRRFLSLTLGGSFLPLIGCSGSEEFFPPLPKPDLLLPNDEKEAANLLNSEGERLFSLLSDLAKNPGKTLRIGFQNGRGMEVLTFSFQDGGAASYRHLRVVRESKGETVNLIWGWKNYLPSVKITDEEGKTLKGFNGEDLEIGFSDVGGTEGRQASDLIATGVKIAAIAFALWLGAGIGRAVLGVIGFLAFNAMVLGLLAASIGVLYPVIEWVKNNVTLEDVESFFRQLVNDIIRLFQEISQLLSQWLD